MNKSKKYHELEKPFESLIADFLKMPQQEKDCILKRWIEELQNEYALSCASKQLFEYNDFEIPIQLHHHIKCLKHVFGLLDYVFVDEVEK